MISDLSHLIWSEIQGLSSVIHDEATWFAPVVLILTVITQIGKAGTHVFYRSEEHPKMHRPLIQGLALTNGYHVLSGIEWFLILFCCSIAYWDRWSLWVLSFLLWGLVWKIQKRFAGKSWKSWPYQIFESIKSRIL